MFWQSPWLRLAEMEYSYRARDASGNLVLGRLTADSREAAAAEIMAGGALPVQLTESQAGVDVVEAIADWQLRRAKVSLDELIVLCRQMYALTRAGIPIIRAIHGLSESNGSKKLRITLRQIADQLESGVNLASCLQDHRTVFSDLFIAVVHVGENTGGLDHAFRQLAENLEMERAARRRVQQAIRYPIMVIVALVAALSIINIFVIPAFSSVFARLGSDLPLPTRVLVATSGFFLNYWWLLLLVAGGGAVAFLKYIDTPQGRFDWDRLKLRIPLVGHLLELVALSRFSRNFALMLAAGLPITQALSLVAAAVGNSFIGRAVAGIRADIERGESMRNAAASAGIFSPLVMQMLAVGEETGQVEDLLVEVADFYDQEVEYSLTRLSDAIEPILIFMMGILVLVLALGVFLPIWSLGEAAIHR
ncbi:MAG: type II secretion system F family protein [Pseudomonadota bacterium]